MDIIRILIGAIIVVLCLIVCIKIKRWRKGFRVLKIGIKGERIVRKQLKRLPTSKYYVLHDIMLPISKGYTQIDHVVVSRYGIFVIETKNYHGRIEGRKSSYRWRHFIGKQQHEFQNPVKQNSVHLRAVQKLLIGYEELEYVSIICFPDTTIVNVEMEDVYVVKYESLRKVIRKHRSDVLLSMREVKVIYEMLKAANVNNKENKKRHIEYIKAKMAAQDAAVKRGICPECGNKLVEKNGEYGKFVGCSGYPECRFTI